MYKFKHILNEANWKESFSAYEILLQYKGKDLWVHFNENLRDSKYNKTKYSKFGVNPKKQHADPLGIYFYPVDWILDDMEDGYKQYAVSQENMYVASLKPNAKILKLHEATEQECEELMTRNGWIDDYKRLVPLLKDGIYSLSSCITPGKKLYAVAQSLTSQYNYLKVENYKPVPWSTLLKGYDGVEDRLGIIMPDEPHQMVVFKKSNVTVVTSAHNKYTSHYDMDFKEALSRVGINDVEFSWLNKKITGKFLHNGKYHYLTYDESSITLTMSIGINGVEMTYFTTTMRLMDNSNYYLIHYVGDELAAWNDNTSEIITNDPLQLRNADIAAALGVKASRVRAKLDNDEMKITCHYPSHSELSSKYFLTFNGNEMRIIISVGNLSHTATYQLRTLNRKGLDEVLVRFGAEVHGVVNQRIHDDDGIGPDKVAYYLNKMRQEDSKVRQMIKFELNYLDD